LKSRKYSLSYLTESVNSVDVMLFSAIIKLDSREIKDLLERGANINTKNSSNRTPLITLMLIQNATEHKILEIAKLLIENNADLDVQEFPDNFTRGETALIKSAKRGFYEIVKTLIEASANWNKFNEDREGFLDFLDVKKCVNELKEKYPEKYKLYITKKRSSSFGL